MRYAARRLEEADRKKLRPVFVGTEECRVAEEVDDRSDNGGGGDGEDDDVDDGFNRGLSLTWPLLSGLLLLLLLPPPLPPLVGEDPLEVPLDA